MVRFFTGDGTRFTWLYDAAGQTVAAINPPNYRTTIIYDAAGRQLATRDANNNRTTNVYHPCGKVVATVNALGYRTTNVFDAAGRQIGLVDPKGNRTFFAYDAVGNQILMRDALLNRTTFAYDAANQQTYKHDPRGFRITYLYDSNGQMIRKLYVDASRVTFLYDANGNRSLASDSLGRYTWAYDARDAVSLTNVPANKRITYAYDGVGNRRFINVQDQGRTTYTYRPDQQIDRLTAFDGGHFTWMYDNAGRNVVQLNPNSTRASLSYDVADEQTKITHLKSDGTVIESFDYAYDLVGNKTRVVEANGDRVTWSYDPSYQLTRDRRSGVNAYDNTYTYDPAMNRALKIASGLRTTYAYNSGNQIRRLENTSGITTFSFDQAGSQTLERTPAGVRTTTVWDYENRLVSKREASGTRTMIYDADHHRVQRTDASGTIVSRWDQENVIRETGPTNSDYTLQPETYGNLLAWNDGSTPYIIHWDGQQSVRRTTDAAGTQNGVWLYDAWGVPLTAAVLPPFGYVGRLGYASDGYVRRRYLSLQMGRWHSTDPIILARIHRDASLFSYCENNPLMYVDPSGLVKIVCLCTCSDPYSRRPDQQVVVDCKGGGMTCCKAACSDLVKPPEHCNAYDWYQSPRSAPPVIAPYLSVKLSPGYGNYCGIHCGEPYEPIDCVDAACRRHDKCYGNFFKTFWTWQGVLCDRRLCEEVIECYAHGCLSANNPEACRAAAVTISMWACLNGFPEVGPGSIFI